MYGTTSEGGSGACPDGCGTVFAVSEHDERVVYQFTGGSDGAGPVGGLIFAGGAFVGITGGGGRSSPRCLDGCGTVFSVTPEGKNDITYRFKGGRSAVHPVARLIEFDGALYGTSPYGGAHTRGCFSGCGTIFRLNLDGKSERVIYRFKGGDDGAQPAAGLIVVDGALYGTTEYGGGHDDRCALGCGTVFRVRKDGVEHVLHRFTYKRGTDGGAYPVAGLTLLDGALYGTTEAGGDQKGEGTIFRMTKDGAERVLHTFGHSRRSHDGSSPQAALIAVNGMLYGTTSDGGAYQKGTIFRVTPSGKERVVYSFMGQPGGAHPDAALTYMDGVLYGTTPDGGELGEGTVFRLRL